MQSAARSHRQGRRKRILMYSSDDVPGIQQWIMFIFLVFVVSFATHSSAQEAKPNLSGTWKLNVSKSKLAPLHHSEDDWYRIKHTEPKMDVVHTLDGIRQVSFYVIDGKERLANMTAKHGEIWAKAYWDVDTLVVERHQEIVASGLILHSASTSRITLSRDRQSMTVNHLMLNGSFDESLTYERRK